VFRPTPPPEGFTFGRVTTAAAAVTPRADTMIYRAVRKDTGGMVHGENQ